MKFVQRFEQMRRPGAISALARALGITHSAVSQWREVPASRALDVEQQTGISRHALRPDVFGPAPTGAA